MNANEIIITGDETVAELSSIKQELITAQLRAQQAMTNLNTEKQQKQNDCWADGERGKKEWFAYYEEWLARRGRTACFLTANAARIARVKDRLRVLHNQAMERARINTEVAGYAAKATDSGDVEISGRIHVDARRGVTYVYFTDRVKHKRANTMPMVARVDVDAGGNVLGVELPVVVGTPIISGGA